MAMTTVSALPATVPARERAGSASTSPDASAAETRDLNLMASRCQS